MNLMAREKMNLMMQEMISWDEFNDARDDIVGLPVDQCLIDVIIDVMEENDDDKMESLHNTSEREDEDETLMNLILISYVYPCVFRRL